MKRGIILIVVILVIAVLFVWWYNQQGNTIISNPPEDWEQYAQTRIQEELIQTQSDFAIFPKNYILERGNSLKMSAGIKNDASDGQAHNFVINIIPNSVSQQNWVIWDTADYEIQANKTRFITIIVEPPTSVTEGTYTFNILACKDMKNSDCTLHNYNWGTPQQLSLTLK